MMIMTFIAYLYHQFVFLSGNILVEAQNDQTALLGRMHNLTTFYYISLH